MKTKLKFIIIPALVLFLSTGLLINTTKSAYNPVSRSLCTLMVKPYNDKLQATYGSSGDQYINYLSSSQCDKHIKYPNAYSPQKPPKSENPLKNNAENKHLPGTKHIHIYYNDSKEDNYYYKSFIDKFEITLQSDGFEHIDINNGIKCNTPVPKNYPPQEGSDGFFNCDGTRDDLFGGTKITKKIDNQNKTVTITWDFATKKDENGNFTGRPYIWGDNGKNFKTYLNNGSTVYLDTNNEENRKLEFSVNLYTEGGEEIWSTTTSSKVLLADLTIKKSNYDNNYGLGCDNNNPNSSKSGWCYLQPKDQFTKEQVQTGANTYRTYYWFPIGSVGTVWKDVGEKEEPSYCTGLKLNETSQLKHISGNMYEFIPDKGITFKVTPSFYTTEVPLNYKWEAQKYDVNTQGIWSVINSSSSSSSSSSSNKVQTSENSQVAGNSQIAGNNNYLTQKENLKELRTAVPIQVESTNNIINNIQEKSEGNFVSNMEVKESVGIDKNAVTSEKFIPSIIDFGKFYKSILEYTMNPSSGKNPFINKNKGVFDNNKSTFYSGGPEGTIIRVQGVDEKDVYVGNNCQAVIIIPKNEEENTCIDLTIEPNQLGPNEPVTFKVTPKFKNDKNPIPLNYLWKATREYSNIVEGFNKVPFEEITESNKVSANTIEEFNKVIFNGFKTGEMVFESFGEFEDYKNAGDLSNPYTEKKDNKTYYTGGSDGTWIKVQAYGKDGTFYPLCNANLQIPPEQEQTEKCLEAKIVQGDGSEIKEVGQEIQIQDKIEYLWVKVKTDPQEYESDLSFSWEVTGGGELYYSENKKGQTIETTNFADPIDLNNPQHGTRVTVKAVDNENDLKNIKICNDSFIVIDSKDEPICKNLNLKNSNPNLKEGETTLLHTSPERQDETKINLVEWSEKGDGYFTLGPKSQTINKLFLGNMCSTPTNSFNQKFQVNSGCDYIYHAQSAGDSFTIKAIPNDGVPACSYTYTVPPDNDDKNPPYCKKLTLTPSTINLGGKTNYDGKATFSDGKQYNVDVEWKGENGSFNQNKTTSNSNNIENSFTHDSKEKSGEITAKVTKVYDPNITDWSLCSISIEKNPKPDDDDEDKEEDQEYKLVKKVNVKNSQTGGFTTTVQTIPQSHTEVWYQLIFTPATNKPTTVTITDDISGGFIEALILPVDNKGKENPGEIKYANQVEVKERATNLKMCSKEITEHCYTGEVGDKNGITLVGITDQVTITYKAKVETGLTDEICRNGQVCQEKYKNSSKAEVTEVNDEKVNIKTIKSNEIIIQIFCQYILTQASGDIFLERDLSYGIDIQQCSEITSSPGIIITPGKPGDQTITSTGAGETTIFTISHELCNAGLTGELSGGLEDIYGQQVVPNLSAQICEVKLPVGSAWKKELITNSIEENKTRLSRWGADKQGNVNISEFGANYQYQNNYHIKDGNLTINQEYTLNDGEGAKTYIIEDGDLIINSNIKYGNCPSGQTCSPRDTASLAFIVLNGNVYIDPSVTEIAGVFFVQKGGNSDSGRFYSGDKKDNDQKSTNQLKVFGSIYGDIDELFKNRLYAGDPIKGEGGIVIRFDQRIIENTPPGLKDVLNLTQQKYSK